MLTVRAVELGEVLDLRDRALTPGHPGRPVVWPYDESATHLGMFDGDRLIGCVSFTAQPMPGWQAERPFHLHSMAIEAECRGRGFGRRLLEGLLSELRAAYADLVWATARPTAVTFYLANGFAVGEELRIAPTNARMRYVWRRLDGGG